MIRRYAVSMLPVLIAMLALLLQPGAAMAVGPEDVVLSTQYPWVVAEKGKAITFGLEVTNRTQSYQELELQVADGPADWKPLFRDRGYTIRKVIVGPSKTQNLEFQVQPPADAKPSDYVFWIKALSPNGVPVSDLRIRISLEEKLGSGLKLSTQYPSLRGQAGNVFSFKMDLRNDATEDRPVNLTASAPQGWEVVFKPAYESKQVSTIRMKAGENQGIDVEVTPPQKAEAGEYTVKVQASAGTDRDEVALKVVILGNYKISLNTATGQLNTRAKVDEESNVNLVVKNTGASTVQNITLSSAKPDEWQVTFSPDKIESLAPGQSQEVTARIKPGPRTLAGDYMLSVTASSQQTSDTKELRVTVETPTLWGWFGIATIAVVFGGLGLMFARLSRR